MICIYEIITLIFSQIKLRTVDMEETPPNNAQPHVHPHRKAVPAQKDGLIKANVLFTEEII